MPMGWNLGGRARCALLGMPHVGKGTGARPTTSRGSGRGRPASGRSFTTEDTPIVRAKTGYSHASINDTWRATLDTWLIRRSPAWSRRLAMTSCAIPLRERSERCSSPPACSGWDRWEWVWRSSSGSATCRVGGRARSTSAWSVQLRQRPRWCSRRSWRATRIDSAAGGSWWPVRLFASWPCSWSRSACVRLSWAGHGFSRASAPPRSCRSRWARSPPPPRPIASVAQEPAAPSKPRR